ncbi:MAG: NADH-quinone oxidoreductase subunit A [Gammaproteobacteria bacterium RIFCSPHIGHO2_12_FULL_45_9]|nr:MAG: NADH-quinone oxidoreductase subunit A [Gammaproteobacteria bacterium RIFCSPHIGHO2_12_FULL_45_9]
MLMHYFPVLIFLVIAIAVGVIALTVGMVVGPRKPNSLKNSPYECGFPAFEDARLPFDVRYYLVAILFIVFDLETAFLFPWAVALRPVGLGALWVMLIFLGILGVGFFYEWRRGALEWE